MNTVRVVKKIKYIYLSSSLALSEPLIIVRVNGTLFSEIPSSESSYCGDLDVRPVDDYNISPPGSNYANVQTSRHEDGCRVFSWKIFR